MTNSLHSFFVYVFFGYLLLYPLLLASLKIFHVQHPKQRMAFYVMALITPFVGYILYHTLLSKRCQVGFDPQGMFWRVFDTFCQTGNIAIRYLAPLLVGMVIFGIIKAVVSIVYVAHLQRDAADPDPTQKERVFAALQNRAQRWRMQVPQVIFSHSTGYAAFAVGFKRPVIVVSLPVISMLSDTELDGLVTHEMVHVRRRDTLTGWFIYLLRDLMFFSPFSTVLLRQYLLERERLCDLETAQALGSPKAYALILLKVSKLLVGGPVKKAAFSAGFVGRKHDLEPRIMSLLSTQGEGSAIPSLLFITLLFALAAAVLVYMGFIC